jgi:hypothetical protein
MTREVESTTVSPRRLLAFRIIAALLGVLFVFAGLSNARAAWMVVVGTSGDLHPELNRWFTTVAGASDLIGAGCLLALAWRPKQPLLFLFFVVGAVLAAAINLPFVPLFAILLAFVVPLPLTYPYWADLRTFTTWWQRPHVALLAVSALAACTVFVVAGSAISRQIGGTDAAAQANWWADYAEHVIGLATPALFASTGLAGWRLLAGLAAAVWIYLGFVAAFVLTDDAGSWGLAGGVAGMAFGVALAAEAIRGERSGSGVRLRHPQPAGD